MRRLSPFLPHTRALSVYLSLSLSPKSNCKSYERAEQAPLFFPGSFHKLYSSRSGRTGLVLSRLEALTFCLVLIGLINVLQFRSVRNPVRPVPYRPAPEVAITSERTSVRLFSTLPYLSGH